MVRYHKFDANFSVVCSFCNRPYTKLNSFSRYLNRKHSAEISELENDHVDGNESETNEIDVDAIRAYAPETDILVKQSAKYLLALKSSHNVSDTAINKKVDATKNFMIDVVASVKIGVDTQLRAKNVNVDVDMDQICNPESMFQDLSTAEKRKVYFEEHFDLLVRIKM